jgi:hypothetical protein
MSGETIKRRNPMGNNAERSVNKRRSVTLTQETDDTFRVQSWTNSSELSVGMIISRKKLNQWCGIPGVEIRVPGFTPAAESDAQQMDLFTKSEVRALKAVIATP